MVYVWVWSCLASGMCVCSMFCGNHDLSRMGMDMPSVDPFKQTNDDLTGTPPAYGSYRYAYPIALSERNANPNMVQNYGY